MLASIVCVAKADLSSDEISQLPRKFLINVESTLQSLQKQEDTDENCQITIEDNGPKARSIVILASTCIVNSF